MSKEGRHFAREYVWFALALIAILLGSTARAATDEPSPGPKKPTTEELERRIAILEQKLEAQQQAIAELLRSQGQAALAQRARSAEPAPSGAARETAAASPPAAPSPQAAAAPPAAAQPPRNVP